MEQQQKSDSALLAYFRLLRPSHWIKNGVVFGGLIFGGRALDVWSDIRAGLAMIVFCALSSLVYIVNDIRDREQDRAHPVKRDRPLAAGAVSLNGAIIVACFLALTGAVGAVYLGPAFGYIGLAYVLLNILYSWALKKIVIVDVMTIAVGFVLRAWAGAVAIDVSFDAGLSIGAFLLALFLGFGKRRHEMLLLGDKSSTHRVSLGSYSPYFLDQLIGVVTAAVVVTYVLYVVSPDVESKLGTHYLWITFPFVLYGVFRYLYLVHQKEGGGSPTTVLLTDLPILLDVLLWLATVALLLYNR